MEMPQPQRIRCPHCAELQAELQAITDERDTLRVRIETEGRLPACSCGNLTLEVWCRRCGRQLG
jgi:hypothetical protein